MGDIIQEYDGDNKKSIPVPKGDYCSISKDTQLLDSLYYSSLYFSIKYDNQHMGLLIGLGKF